MQHSFDVDIAKKYGIIEAILLNNMWFWIEKNKANGTNYYDGYYWTYNSTRAFSELFPYASQRKIQNALKHLIEEDILQTGNYNKLAYDRTLWYAFTKKGECIMQKREMDYTEKGNGKPENVQPIPYINSNNKNTNINTDNKGNKSSRFIPPTVEEVRDYCNERNNNIDAENFVDYYESKGWMIGRNKMKDWKASVRTWERNGYSKPKNKVGSNGIRLAENRDDSLDDIF